MASTEMAVHPSDPVPVHDRTDVDRLLAGYRAGRAQQTLFDLRPPSLQGPAIGYDEFLDETGSVRSAWTDLADAVGDRGKAGMTRLGSAVRQLVDNDDITYTVVDPAGGHGEPRPWRLDPLPLVVSAPDWEVLESGLVQRSRVLNACWPTYTAIDARSPKAYCLRSCSSPIPATSAPPTESRFLGTTSSSCTPAMSAELPTAASK